MLTVDIPRIIAHVAGIVREGPSVGDGNDDDDSDNEDGEGESNDRNNSSMYDKNGKNGKNRNKQPHLFTMPEIDTKKYSMSIKILVFVISFLVFLLITFLILNRNDTNRYMDVVVKLFNNIKNTSLDQLDIVNSKNGLNIKDLKLEHNIIEEL